MAESWLLRKGTKRSGFRYVTRTGAPAPAAARERAAALAIPPAWRDVHVAASAAAAVQAWGYDAKGRKQYRYHDRAAERGQLRKFHRMRRMAKDLPAIRAQLARDLRARGLTRRRVAAGVVALIAEAFFRVGSERYAEENRTFGVATLRKRHVAVRDGRAVFDYVGKESVRQRQTVCDPRLVKFVRELLRSPGPRMFRYQADDGRGRAHWCDLTARDVNEYLHDVLGVPYTAKDFRTWGGTLRLATILADLGPGATPRETQKNVVVAVRLVAAELGNTPTVCRQAYVHPIVIARYVDDGATIAPFLAGPARARAVAGHPPEERALIRFLDRYFPEQRTQRRDRRRRGRAEAADRRAARAVAEVRRAA